MNRPIRKMMFVLAAIVAAFAAPALRAQPVSPVPAPTNYLPYYMERLSPYGSWIELPGLGMCWRPAVAQGWRPYCDDGIWIWTDWGWYWQSDLPWGDVVFHYGRWMRTLGSGWVWVPDDEWGPAWVCWRDSDEDQSCGWAPLPPGAVYYPGQGLFFGGALVLDGDFGLTFDLFVFVPYGHFADGHYRRFAALPDRARFAYEHSAVRNGYRASGKRFFVAGVDTAKLGAATHHPFQAVPVYSLAPRRPNEAASPHRATSLVSPETIPNAQPGFTPVGAAPSQVARRPQNPAPAQSHPNEGRPPAPPARPQSPEPPQGQSHASQPQTRPSAQPASQQMQSHSQAQQSSQTQNNSQQSGKNGRADNTQKQPQP